MQGPQYAVCMRGIYVAALLGPFGVMLSFPLRVSVIETMFNLCVNNTFALGKARN